MAYQVNNYKLFILDKKKDSDGLIDALVENVKRKYNWDAALRVPLVTK